MVVNLSPFLPVRRGPSNSFSGLTFLSGVSRCKNTDFAGLVCELVEREGSQHSMHHE